MKRQKPQQTQRAKPLRVIQTVAASLLWSVLQGKHLCEMKFCRQLPIGLVHVLKLALVSLVFSCVAETLGRLTDLKARIGAVPPSNKQQSLAKRTLMTLVDVAAGDRDAIEQALADRFSNLRQTKDAGSFQTSIDSWWYVA